MTVIDQLAQSLKSTKGNLHARAVVSAEFLLSALPEEERTPLRAVVDAGSILRWFDADLLARVLQIPNEDALKRYRQIKTLPFVERFLNQERESSNIHEATRLGWRKHLFREQPERFRELSARASACFAENPASTDRLEWIYHLLCADPDKGATELEKLDREWSSIARPEERDALANALKELQESELVSDRALIWVLLVRSWTDWSRRKTAGLIETAHFIVQKAAPLRDPRAEAEAKCLLGNVLQAQGQLAEAREAFTKTLIISRRLAKQDPGNAGWQRDLAVAYSKIGYVLQAQGELKQAQDAFRKDLAISRQLTKQDPRNVGWQQDLAATYSSVGRVLHAQGKLKEAQRVFKNSLAISRKLAEQDPSHPGWQRDLAVANSKLGDVLQAQGKLKEAQAAFKKSLTISQQLAEEDPSQPGWLRGLAVAHCKMGDVLLAQGQLAEAQDGFTKELAISQKLAAQDPSNAGWQRDLAVAFLRLARLKKQTAQRSIALSLYEETDQIYKVLLKKSPEASEWKKEYKEIKAEIARYRANK